MRGWKKYVRNTLKRPVHKQGVYITSILWWKGEGNETNPWDREQTQDGKVVLPTQRSRYSAVAILAYVQTVNIIVRCFHGRGNGPSTMRGRKESWSMKHPWCAEEIVGLLLSVPFANGNLSDIYSCLNKNWGGYPQAKWGSWIKYMQYICELHRIQEEQRTLLVGHPKH